MFSPEELEELRRADAEIEAEFEGLTEEELTAADRRDEAALSDPARSRKERDRARYQRHRETILANAARWRAENREKFLATQASYRERHREELREKELAYYYAHRDEINARRRAKRKASRESSVVSRENAGARPWAPRRTAEGGENMKDPVKLEGGAVIDRAAIKAVLREGGRVLIFFGGERPLVLADNFSTEEIEKLSEKTE